jgi:hypothetical protein
VSAPRIASFVVDTTPPTLTAVHVNGGAATTTSTAVSVSVEAADAASGAAELSLSNDGLTWGAWRQIAPSPWTVSTGDGPKTVYARVRDGAGNVSEARASMITLSEQSGSEYTVSINSGALFTNQTDVTLALGARQSTMSMQVSNDGGFSGATWEPYAAQKAWQITRYGDFVIPRTVYVRFKDVLGTVSPTFQDDIVLDLTAPTGSVSLSNGAMAADSTNRVIQLKATDDLSIASRIQMRLSNRADFAGAIWQPLAESAPWSFGGGGTVYVQFRDGAGNVSQTYQQSLPGSHDAGTSPTPPSCSPRPRVVVKLQSSNGTLLVTLSTTGPNNGLRAVRFDSFTSSIVDVGSQTNQTHPFTVSIPAGQEPSSLQFVVRRDGAAQTATVRLVVVDGCGEWSTLVGGGMAAFR